MKKLVFILWLFAFEGLTAQDTLTVLQYNLLQYGNNYGGCNNSNNDITSKDNYIKTIINYLKPDIFSVNEMVADEIMMEHLRGKLNQTWTNRYRRPPFESINADYIANTIYYNSKKLIFQKQYIVQTFVRDVNMFMFYYNSPALLQGDTAFIYCVVGHLKAGSGTSDENKRKEMAINIMDFLKNFDSKANYLLMGDFNLYTYQEPAYQEFINNSNDDIRMNDPIDQPGTWHNNYGFRNIHTQSTHLNDNGCATPGGMDDRFDFILISKSIKYGWEKVEYVNASYQSVGQDGKHYNKGLLDSPINTAVPYDVLQALGNNSDHLPVMLKLAINQPVGIFEQPYNFFTDVTWINPASNNLFISANAKGVTGSTIAIYDLAGKRLYLKFIQLNKGINHLQINIPELKQGLYVFHLSSDKGGFFSGKFIVQ